MNIKFNENPLRSSLFMMQTQDLASFPSSPAFGLCGENNKLD